MSYGALNTASRTGDRGPGNDQTDDHLHSSTSSLNSEDENKWSAASHRVRHGISHFYDRNFGLFLVLLAQMFGSLMTASTRVLETSFDTKFHALQIIFVRMSATSIFSLLYMWYKKVPEAPFGNPKIRALLLLRGTAGFIGLFGIYYSLSYLNLSDATVITFLTPILTAFLCFVALREPFTLKEGLAGLIALGGVLFIARPTFLFPQPTDDKTLMLMTDTPQEGLIPDQPVTPLERSIAVLAAMLGAFGAATAYSTIRVIGKRAHSLVSVNYFAMIATMGSFVIIMAHPNLHFEIPQSTLQWILLTAIGLAGFMLQFLLTEGLQREKGGRATNLMYTQLVFALIIERVIWGTVPSVSSLVGGTLIIGAAIWSSVQKSKTPDTTAPRSVDEESRLLANDGNSVEDQEASTSQPSARSA